MLTQWLPWGWSLDLAQLSGAVILLCLVWIRIAVYIATRLLPERDAAVPAHPLTGRLPTRAMPHDVP